MRTLLPLSFLAAVAVPLVAPVALEAVAQSPVGGGSSAGAVNLATDAKLSAVKAEAVVLKQTVTELNTKIQNVSDCAAQGLLWNGESCVAPGVVNTSSTVTNITNNSYQGVVMEGDVVPLTAAGETVSVNLDNNAVVNVDCYAQGAHTLSDKANAGLRVILKIDGHTCSEDYSFNYPTDNVTFSVAASCSRVLPRGKHTLRCALSAEAINSAIKGELGYTIVKPVVPKK